MAEIFVSYRREDSKHLTARLVEQLRDRFGDERVFRDRDSITPGQDFAEAIERDLSECRVLLAVIGPQWLQAVRRRLADPRDFVRIEVGTALKLKPRIATIAVLADGATLPSREDLPQELATLPENQWEKLDDDRFESDVARLIEVLEKKYGILRVAKERALASVRVLCQFIGVLLLTSGTWLGSLEAATAFGLGAVLSRQPRRNRGPRVGDPSSLGSLLWSSLNGGLIGGAVAGLVIAIVYSWQERKLPPPGDVAEIVLFAMSVGAAAGASAQLGMSLFRYLAETRKWPTWLFNDVIGGALGCSVGVMPLGMVGGLLFGDRKENAISLDLLAVAPLLGMSVAIVLYDTGGRWKRMIFYAAVPVLIIGPFVAPAFQLFGVDLSVSGVRAWLITGAKIGTILGFAMGLQIGLGLFLYRRAGLGSNPGH